METSRIVLKRSGQRPLNFEGALLAEASSWSTQRALWYEGAIFETDRAAFAVAITAYHKADGIPDIHYAWPCATAQDAASTLRAHNPARDVPISTNALEMACDPDALEAEAARLRAAIDGTREAFEAMIRTLLPDATCD